MERTFVPIDREVPSVWRVLRRDSTAGLAAVFFVLGVAAATLFVIDHLGSKSAKTRTVSSYSGFSLPKKPRKPPLGVSWLVVGLALATLAPLRVASIRHLFRRGTEVVGHVERAGPLRRGAFDIHYRYQFEGQRYTGTHSMRLATSLAYDAPVQVVVDPSRPSRSVLKHAFILEAVDQIPRVRVV